MLLDAATDEELVEDEESSPDDVVEPTPGDTVVLNRTDRPKDVCVDELMEEKMVGEETVLLELNMIKVELEEGTDEPVLVVLVRPTVEDERTDGVATATLAVVEPELIPEDRGMVVPAELVEVLLARESDEELCNPELVGDADEAGEEETGD